MAIVHISPALAARDSIYLRSGTHKCCGTPAALLLPLRTPRAPVARCWPLTPRRPCAGPHIHRRDAFALAAGVSTGL